MDAWAIITGFAVYLIVGPFVLAYVDIDGALLRWFDARPRGRYLFDPAGLVDLTVQFAVVFAWPAIAFFHWRRYARHRRKAMGA